MNCLQYLAIFDDNITSSWPQDAASSENSIVYISGLHIRKARLSVMQPLRGSKTSKGHALTS